MKKLFFAFLPWLFTAFSYKAMAQEDKIEKTRKKESQEIIIRKKGDKDANITVQITGDKVLINGKPLVDFKDDEITINNKKITIRDGDHIMEFNGLDDMNFNFENEDMRGMMGQGMKRTFLGVNTDQVENGAKITAVTKESPAASAGLQKGDIITKVGDKKIDGPQMLSEVIGSMKPNEEVKVYYKRDGKDKSAKATLKENKNIDMRSFSYTSPRGGFKTFSIPRMPRNPVMPRIQGWNNAPGGMDMENFTDEMFMRHQKLGLKIQDTDEGNGVKVLEVEDNSAAALAGLKKDDVITQIGGDKVLNTDEAREKLQDNIDKSSYPVKIKRNGSDMDLTIKIPKKLKTVNL